MDDKDLKRHNIIRKEVQSVCGILSNANLRGFLTGKIYTGPLKRFCVPGMNCYSCPGALGACPIGAMQSVFDGRRRKFAFYVVGFLAAIGLFVGRFICGWLCLFGLIEELLYMIPVPKIRVPAKIDKILRYFKYPVLIILVFALPFFYWTDVGTGDPFFCKYVCPVGTLEGGIPLLLANESLRSSLGALFGWKAALLVLCILSSMFIYRPFCKYVCPLGAFYSLFQKISLLRMRCDKDACINCGKCAGICPMNVDPSKTPNSAECIRCGECIKACPKKALAFSVWNKEK